jgi:hypothetical protein
MVALHFFCSVQSELPQTVNTCSLELKAPFIHSGSECVGGAVGPLSLIFIAQQEKNIIFPIALNVMLT